MGWKCHFKGVKYAVRAFYASGKGTALGGNQGRQFLWNGLPADDAGPAYSELLVPHMYWPMDENCQSLNIWTPSIDPEAKRPVMVWLHGGGFSAGSSIEHITYEGANMAKYGDVVVVSLNHR